MAASSKIDWASAEEASGEGPLTAQKTMSSWGGLDGVRKWGDSSRRRWSSRAAVMARFESLGEDAAGDVGKELLGRPESYGGGAGAGALEGDLAEVEVLGGEVGVGGVVFVEAADGWGRGRGCSRSRRVGARACGGR